MWTRADDGKLVAAWEAAAGECGGADVLYAHFAAHCGEGEASRTKAAAQVRKQSLRAMATLIASFCSLKADDRDANASDGGDGPLPHTQCVAWFRQSARERLRSFKKVNTSMYGYIDMDEVVFDKLQQLEKATKLHKVALPVPWSREELAAFVNAWAKSKQDPVPQTRSGASERTRLYRDFVTAVGGKTRRGLQSVAGKLLAMENFVELIDSYNAEVAVDCDACSSRRGWFSLPPPQQRSEYERRNNTSHRYFSMDAALYESAKRALAPSVPAAQEEHRQDDSTAAAGPIADPPDPSPATAQDPAPAQTVRSQRFSLTCS